MIAKAFHVRRLGIDLASKEEQEIFKWFLACLLFCKPIQTEIVEQACRALVAAKLTSPQAILRAGWDELVRLLDRNDHCAGKQWSDFRRAIGTKTASSR